MENILPEEQSLRTAIYAAFRNITELCEFLLQVRISKHKNLTSHLTTASRGW